MDFRIYDKKKVFLTGHTGFKGSWLSEWLLSLGADLTGFSIDVPTSPSHFEVLQLSKRMNDIRGDINDYNALKTAMEKAQPEVIFHLAAQPLVRASYDDPLETFQTNAMGTAHVLDIARSLPSAKAVVVITTDKCYENVGWEYGYREIDPLGGHDPYSASKALAEIITSSYVRSFFSNGKAKVCSARAGNVIGGGDWAVDRIIPDCMRSWSEGKPVIIRNPASVRPWQHVLEPLGAYLLLGQRLLEEPEGVHGEGFNFGPSAELDRTTLELVHELEKNWTDSPGFEVAAHTSEKKEARTLRLNCDKALVRLHWLPRLNFPKTAQWTGEWYHTFLHKPEDTAKLTKQQIEKYEELLHLQG